MDTTGAEAEAGDNGGGGGGEVKRRRDPWGVGRAVQGGTARAGGDADRERRARVTRAVGGHICLGANHTQHTTDLTLASSSNLAIPCAHAQSRAPGASGTHGVGWSAPRPQTAMASSGLHTSVAALHPGGFKQGRAPGCQSSARTCTAPCPPCLPSAARCARCAAAAGGALC